MAEQQPVESFPPDNQRIVRFRGVYSPFGSSEDATHSGMASRDTSVRVLPFKRRDISTPHSEPNLVEELGTVLTPNMIARWEARRRALFF